MLLDTAVVINLLRGDAGTVERARRLDSHPLLSAVTVDEVVRGMRPGEEERVAAMLAWPDLVAVGAEEAWIAGAWRRDFAAQGVTLSQADCLIAACAARHGGRLATANPRDFPMGGLDVEDWTPR